MAEIGIRKITNRNLAIGNYLKMAWYFDKTWEKIVLVILCWLGILRIIQWVI